MEPTTGTNGPPSLTPYGGSTNGGNPRRIARELAAMRLMVKVESLSDDDLKLQIETYTRRLCEYPLQAALKAIRRWPSTNKFWPAWSELRAEVDSITSSLESRALLEGPQEPTGGQIARDCQCWVCKLERERGTA